MSADPPGLPPAADAALANPPEPELGTIAANGIVYGTRAWGDPSARPVLLIHGVTSTSRIWWRVGPALAAGLARHVIAIDQAGHGRTRGWLGHHRFRDNALDLIALIEAGGLDGPELRVVGHSWGAMTAAWFPALGLETEVLVLLDPPGLSVAEMATMLDDPIERHYDDVDEAIAALGPLNPTWGYGDVVAKAEGLASFDVDAVRAVLMQNGDWDGGLGALSEAGAERVVARLVRGEWATGGLIPDDVAEAFAARLGAEHVLTIRGGSHSPMRTRPEATAAALLRALEP